jgi:tetratricopeptide (TPR) repeat protein
MFDFLKNFNLDDFWDDDSEEPRPDYFYEWDAALSGNRSIHFLDGEELSEIIEIYLDDDEYDKARQTIEYALKFHPKDDDLLHAIFIMLKYSELWNDLLDLSEYYSDLSEAWVDEYRITALLRLGMEEDAFPVFQKAQRKYADDAEQLCYIYKAMGEALMDIDFHDAAIGVIQGGIKRLGAAPDLFWLLLRLYTISGLKEEAMSVADQLEQLNPMDGRTWHRLGMSYLSLKESDKATEAFEFAEALGLQTDGNYFSLIAAYVKNGNLQKALEKAKEYIHLYPDIYMVYMVAADICSELELWEEALAFINEALQRTPDRAALYLYKGRLLIHLGEQKKAILTLEEGIRRTEDKRGDLKKELEKLYNEHSEK